MAAQPQQTVLAFKEFAAWSRQGWRRGVAVECRIRNQEVVGSSLGRALRRKNSGQVSHTYVPLSPSSINWYWPEGGDARRLGR